MNQFKMFILNKKFLISFFFFVFAIITEMITFKYLGFGFFPKYISLDISIVLIICCFTYLIPNYRIQRIITTFIMIAQIFLSYMNITLFNIFGTVMTLDMVNLISEAGKAADSSVLGLNVLVIFIVLSIIYLFINYYVLKRVSFNIKTTFNLKKVLLKTSIVILIITVSSIFYKTHVPKVSAEDDVVYNKKIIGNDAYLYQSLLFRSEALKKFGTYSLYLKDFTNTFSVNDDPSIEYEDSIKFIEEGEMSKKGQYTGISEGNNVIVILAESLEWSGIDPELTPTLYDLSQNHVSMNSYYSKSKTNYSETIGMLGSYPLDQSIASVLPNASNVINNNFDYSLPNMLKEKGYGQSSFLINHDKYFYSRNLTHYNFGFDELYDITDFDVKDPIEHWADWTLDSEFFKSAKDVIAPGNVEEPFFTWITTMVMHGPYEGNYRFQPYYDKIDASDWVNPLAGSIDEDHMRNFMAAAMDLDAALDFLFDDLEEKGILDKTTVVIYSDHNAYYYDIGAKAKGLDISMYYDPETYRIPFLIYDQNLPSMQIDHFTKPYDVITTVFDLLGVEYNQNLYLGSSVFMPEESSGCFISLTGGIYNENIYTNNGTDFFVVGDNVSDKEIQEFSVKVNNALKRAVHINNLYKYDLLNKINSEQNH